MNESVWGKDAASFKPERWIVDGGTPAPADRPHGWNGLLSFSDGPRLCIGYRLGTLEELTRNSDSCSFSSVINSYIGSQDHLGNALTFIRFRNHAVQHRNKDCSNVAAYCERSSWLFTIEN
jgi:hypothetical protein